MLMDFGQAEQSEEMCKDPVWAVYGPFRPDPGQLEESERRRGDIVLSPVKQESPFLLGRIV